MSVAVRRLQDVGRAGLARCDRAANALYGWRYNPLYHSGALAVGCFIVLSVTGLYLLLFYRIGSPYESVAGITGQTWTGRWIRSLHRYVSDLAIVAVLIHAVRMAVQNRAWGPRSLAWISGIVLLGAFLVCGWTGYVMVWDVQAQLLAAEGARLFDLLPLFSEPIGRTFVGERAMPSAFFFLNLFAHIAIPVGILLILWIHVSRLARTYLMPPKRLFWGMVAAFTAASVVWPVGMDPEAELLRLPEAYSLDVFYNAWVPLSRDLPPALSWSFVAALLALALAVPWLTRAPASGATASYVNPRFCTGCEQCYHDCPYEAISMVRRDDGRDGFVGLVDPAKCVSCGICAGSCAPMGVGPPGRTGRDQLVGAREFLARATPSPDDIVVLGCENAAAGRVAEDMPGVHVLPVSCAGSLHTSVIELLIRAGVGGVVVATCPPRDCWNREGVSWLEERVYNEREAELKDRVDRRRLRIVYAAQAERDQLRAELDRFRAQVRALGRALGERGFDVGTACDPPPVSVAEEVGS